MFHISFLTNNDVFQAMIQIVGACQLGSLTLFINGTEQYNPIRHGVILDVLTTYPDGVFVDVIYSMPVFYGRIFILPGEIAGCMLLYDVLALLYVYVSDPVNDSFYSFAFHSYQSDQSSRVFYCVA